MHSFSSSLDTMLDTCRPAKNKLGGGGGYKGGGYKGGVVGSTHGIAGSYIWHAASGKETKWAKSIKRIHGTANTGSSAPRQAGTCCTSGVMLNSTLNGRQLSETCRDSITPTYSATTSTQCSLHAERIACMQTSYITNLGIQHVLIVIHHHIGKSQHVASQKVGTPALLASKDSQILKGIHTRL